MCTNGLLSNTDGVFAPYSLAYAFKAIFKSRARLVAENRRSAYLAFGRREGERGSIECVPVLGHLLRIVSNDIAFVVLRELVVGVVIIGRSIAAAGGSNYNKCQRVDNTRAATQGLSPGPRPAERYHTSVRFQACASVQFDANPTLLIAANGRGCVKT